MLVSVSPETGVQPSCTFPDGGAGILMAGSTSAEEFGPAPFTLNGSAGIGDDRPPPVSVNPDY